MNKKHKTFFQGSQQLCEGFISPLHCVAYFSLKTFQDVRVKSVEHNIDRDIDQAKYWLIVLIACWAVGNSLEINQCFVFFYISSLNPSITWTLIIVLNAKVEPASTPTQSENTSDSISVWQKTIVSSLFRLLSVRQVERKRHIGNDIVTIVFQEGDDASSSFKPSMIRSHFTRILHLTD